MNQLIINLSDEPNQNQIEESNTLFKLSIIQKWNYLGRFVHGDIQRENLFPSSYQ